MDTTPRPAEPRPTARTALRRGLGAAGAAVVVAFVGTTGLGGAQAHAAGIAGGLDGAGGDWPERAGEPAQAPLRNTGTPHPHHHRPPAAHPANLPAATTVAVRYSFDNGELIRL